MLQQIDVQLVIKLVRVQEEAVAQVIFSICNSLSYLIGEYGGGGLELVECLL